MNTLKIEGVLPALVTPLKEDNRTVNTDVTGKLIDFHLSQGANGFYVLGGTGEGLVVDFEQRKVMAEAAIAKVAHRVPVIIHIAAMNLNEAIALARHAEAAGADAIAAVPPCFFYYDDEDLYQYYKKLADSVHIPVIVYYHPGAQKAMAPELISRIFTIDNVTGVKWSSGDLYSMMRLKDLTQGDMNIINGPDELLAMGLLAGADAGIGSTYNIMLPQFLQIYNAMKNNDFGTAHDVQMKVNRVIQITLKYELIPAVKCALEFMGFPVGNATFPMRQLTDAQKAAFRKDLTQVGFPY